MLDDSRRPSIFYGLITESAASLVFHRILYLGKGPVEFVNFSALPTFCPEAEDSWKMYGYSQSDDSSIPGSIYETKETVIKVS